MSYPMAPYLELLRKQLETSLIPRDSNSRKVPLYGHRILTMLLLREKALPALQLKALAAFSDLLDELCAELEVLDGGMILIPQLMHHVRTTPDYQQAEAFLQRATHLLSLNPSEAGRILQRKVSTITFDLQQAFGQAVNEQDMKPVDDEAEIEPLTAEQKVALRDYLRARFQEDVAVEICKVKSIIGGGSKQTLIIELHNAKTLPSAIVVRVDKAEGVVGSTVLDEYQLIKLVFEAGIPAPRPFAVEADKAVLGAPFIIVSRIEGHNVGDWFELDEPSRAFAVGVARTLAKLHNIPPEAAGDHLPGAKITTRERVQQEVAVYEQSWRTWGEPSIAMEQALGWIKAHMAFADGKRSIIHGDVGCHNMLGKNGELTALLDWETAVIGNPAHDLIYTYVFAAQMMPWDEYLGEYEKAGGTIPSKAEMDFYRVYCALFGIHFMFMARSFFYSGLSTSMIHAYATQRLMLYTEDNLHRAVKLALERDD